MEEDRDQRRDLRLEAAERFVKQQWSANLDPAAARRRGTFFFRFSFFFVSKSARLLQTEGILRRRCLCACVTPEIPRDSQT